jgi:hypothetical protein
MIKIAPSPDLKIGTEVTALKDLDPEGANVKIGMKGKVFARKNEYNDGAGPMVKWSNGCVCNVYDGQVKIIREPKKERYFKLV